MSPLLWLFLALVHGAPTTQPVRVVDKLMPQTVSRPRPQDAVVDTVMLHFTSLVLSTPDAPYDIDRMIAAFTEYRVSAHYLIDRDGTVYRLVPEDRAAFHAGRGALPWRPGRTDKLNATSIGIEMFAIGSEHDMRLFMKPEAYRKLAAAHLEFIGFTDAQYAALEKLLADIRTRHPQVKHDREHVVGHDEYAPTRRSDPGELFDWPRIGLPKERPATRPATQPMR